MNTQSYFSRLRQRFSLRHSIRRRIMVIFIGLMASMLLAVWAINNFWLEHYYVSQKQEVMEQAYQDINCVVMEQVQAGKSVSDIITEEQRQEWENWVQDRKQPNASESRPKASSESSRKTLLGTIRTYGDHNNITTVLIDSYTGTILLRSDWETDFLARKVQQYVLGMDADRSKVLKQGENYVIEMNYDSRTNATYVESWGYFSDNKMCIRDRLGDDAAAVRSLGEKLSQVLPVAVTENLASIMDTVTEVAETDFKPVSYTHLKIFIMVQ